MPYPGAAAFIIGASIVVALYYMFASNREEEQQQQQQQYPRNTSRSRSRAADNYYRPVNGWNINPSNDYQNKRRGSSRIEDHPICSICRNTLTDYEGVILQTCNHVFHEKCITKWGRMEKTCPNCRQQMQ